MDEESLTNHPAIRRANSASAAKIEQYVPRKQTVRGKPYSVHASRSSDLTEAIKTAIWTIFETNMKTIYESSDVFPWDPEQKQKQMFHEYARFLLITPDSQKEDISLLSAEEILAYAIFRFERDEGRNVVYVYELQTGEGSRRSGLGKALIENLESIGREFRMSGIMLTHIKLNTEAETFYESLNFKVDMTSPDYEGEQSQETDDGGESEDEDSDSDQGYSILWRSIQRNK